MTTSTNTLSMSTYLEMVNSEEYKEATLDCFNRGQEIGVNMFKRKIENRIEYYENSIRTKQRVLKNTTERARDFFLGRVEDEIEIYKAKIEELQFLMGE